MSARAGVYRPKVSCIGRNKTGTTSMAALLEHYGFRVGPQREVERLLLDLGWTPGARLEVQLTCIPWNRLLEPA